MPLKNIILFWRWIERENWIKESSNKICREDFDWHQIRWITINCCFSNTWKYHTQKKIFKVDCQGVVQLGVPATGFVREGPAKVGACKSNISSCNHIICLTSYLVYFTCKSNISSSNHIICSTSYLVYFTCKIRR